MIICNIFKEVKTAIGKKEIEESVTAVFQRENKTGEVSVHIISDEKIKKLNEQYRGINKVTDVLSFATQDGDKMTQSEITDWGDIFISLPQIKRQAKEYGVSEQNEFNRMLVHGVLHLFGYDHQDKKSQVIMFKIQDEIIAAL